MPVSRALINGWPLVSGQAVASQVVALGALSLSKSTATVGTAFTATIQGNTPGSTIAISGSGSSGLSVSGSSVSGTPTSLGSVNLTETLAGAANSPNTTNGVATVSASGGGGNTDPPPGFAYLSDPDGSRLTDPDGAYLMEAA